MKKLFALILALLMLCSCGVEEPVIEEPQSEEEVLVPEKEKGEASDSFKRACFNWGIGRELCASPRHGYSWSYESYCRAAKRSHRSRTHG